MGLSTWTFSGTELPLSANGGKVSLTRSVFGLAPLAASLSSGFFFNDTATTEIYTLSLHDALPISEDADFDQRARRRDRQGGEQHGRPRSEEHTSELQSLAYLVCRLLLEKKKKKSICSTLKKKKNKKKHRKI